MGVSLKTAEEVVASIIFSYGKERYECVISPPDGSGMYEIYAKERYFSGREYIYSGREYIYRDKTSYWTDCKKTPDWITNPPVSIPQDFSEDEIDLAMEIIGEVT